MGETAGGAVGDGPASTVRAGRAAALTFLAVEVGALFWYTSLGRRTWFFNDEWDFLANRRAGDIGGLLRSHLGHPVVLPILAFRLLWWTFGLRTYVPYQALSILAHLIAAWLVWLVMRRAGVGPWVATMCASVVVLFGRGEQNILYAFQITLVGSLVFGLTHLVLADHDGGFDRRDWLGLLAGFAGLLCSGVAFTMIVVVGVATWTRRGWRIALAHTAPLGALYLAWYVAFSRGSYTTRPVTARSVAHFVVVTLANVFRSLGSNSLIGVLLFSLLIVGLIVAWRPLARSERRRRGSAVFALLVGAAIFTVSTALGRAGIPGASERGRYLHIVALMIMPAIGVAADALVRTSRAAAITVMALLALGIPGNVSYIDTFTRAQEPGTRSYRATVLELPRLSESASLPRSFTPLPDISIGWLRDGTASGRIPPPDSQAQRAAAALLLGVRATSPRVQLGGDCRAISSPTTIRLQAGETIQVLRATFEIRPQTGPIPGVFSRAYRPYTALTPQAGPVTFRVIPRKSGPRPVVCGPSEAFGGGS